jgi:hypothetical protein
MRFTSAIDSAASYRGITLTMIVTFAVTFGFLYWRQKPREAPLPVTASPVPRQLKNPEHARPGLPARSIEPAVPRAPPDTLRAEKSAAPPLPVLLTFAPRGGGSREDGSAGDAVMSEAHFVNSSDKDLAITIIALDLPTQETSEAHVFLGANAEGLAGPEEGLKMHPGDRITLHSEGFMDLEFTAP